MGTSMNVRGLLGECKRRNDVGRYAELDDESARLGKSVSVTFFFLQSSGCLNMTFIVWGP
jgi:hypothetical protein